MHELVEQTRDGLVRAASRLISLLEDQPHRLPELMTGMGDWPQARLVVGLTGAPGVGKSTLTDAMLTEWRVRLPGARLGVIAVDPSSPFTGGAVLGDRVRMMGHSTDPLIFIRSLASRGHLGGLTLGVKGTLRVMGLLGCELVIIETVGVGQSEVEVIGVADMVVIALAPGQGDGVQMLKAGLMEAGDMFVINKADRQGADRLIAELKATLSLANSHRHGLAPTVNRCSAVDHIGIPELVTAIEERYAQIRTQIASWRRNALKRDVSSAILQAAYEMIEDSFGSIGPLEPILQRVLSGQATVEQMAEQLLLSAAHPLKHKEAS
ncbi:MAG: methylmalonyl Co-A mutase-associated GTPase MeaB [Phycisphaerales bacterium]